LISASYGDLTGIHFYLDNIHIINTNPPARF
jgi:hypothetical protein